MTASGTAAADLKAVPASLWRHGDFLRLWAGQTISEVGSSVTLLALPLAAILVLRATAFQVALLSAVGFLPLLLFGLPAGVWADRVRRRPIMIVTDAGRAALLLSVPVAYVLGVLGMAQLYAVAFAAGTLSVFFNVAYQSYVPSLVDRALLVDANAKLQLTSSAAEVAGPGLAGVLIQVVTAPVAIAADCLSFVGSALLVLSIRRRGEAVDAGARASAAPPGMIRPAWEGLRFLLGHELLRPVAVTAAANNLFGGMIQALLFVHAIRDLHVPAGLVGAIPTIGNAGLIIGATATTRLVRRLGIGPTIVVSGLVAGAAGLVVPLAGQGNAVPVMGLAWFLYGLGTMVFNVAMLTVRQSVTPPRMLGRVTASMRTLVWTTIPVGALLAGLLAGVIGVHPTLWVAGAGSLVAFLPLVPSPLRRLRQVPAADAA
jgi:MFS family permease